MNDGYTNMREIYIHWDNNKDRRMSNDGWGMCNTGQGMYGNCCIFGGIRCNVDHRTIKILNEIEDLREQMAITDNL